ncbi:MAG TPA: hypothetical protein VK742_16975 [Candidatus Sulfotelmatobacter sp.]|nr:hypothetical protein [Candidatus Sulfotelmatobacter sp.]
MLVAGYIVIPFIGFIFMRLGLLTFPDIGDDDLQAPPQSPDSPLDTVLTAAWKIFMFPVIAMGLKFNPHGIMLCFLLIAPGPFWAFFIELLCTAKNRLWPKKPQTEINSNRATTETPAKT